MAILFGRDPFPVVIAFLCCGVLVGVTYDLFRIKRRLFGQHPLVVFADDVFVMLFCGMLVLLCAYAFNDGNFKWYELPCMFFGFSAYRVTLSRVVIGVCFACIGYLKILLKRMLCPIGRGVQRAGKRSAYLSERLYLKYFTRSVKKKLGTIRIK